MTDNNIKDAILFGTISVTIVSMLSLFGAFLAPLLQSQNKNRWLQFFLAMAVSTLSTDAILHIIPQILSVGGGGHGHSHGGPEHHHHGEHRHNTSTVHDHNSTVIGEDHEGNDSIKWYSLTDERKSLLRLSVIVITIYLLYLIEYILLYRKQMEETRSKISKKTRDGSECSNEMSVDDDSANNNNREKKEEDREKSGHELVNLKADVDESSVICGLKSRALIILLGDAVHNLVDGIAIGTSFLVSYKLGIITSIAVVCHELPHEIGDLAVLVDSGLSLMRALVLNLLSALTAYIGLFISILLGRNDEIEGVLLSITAGMFLYVAWVDMLSHLKHESSLKDNWIISCILQFCGFASGFALIFALGWFE